jgi:hypothetical protein
MTTATVTAKTPNLLALMKAIGPAGRTTLNNGAAAGISDLVQRHILGLASSRHATATRLQAMPTGHLAKAARSVQHASDDKGGSVSVFSPGFARVFRDLTIVPRVAEALTLPRHALSYGRRVSELRRMGISVYRPKGTNILATNIDGKQVTLYALVKSVRLRQDRTLLPATQTMESTGRDAILRTLQLILQKGTGK